MTVKVITPELSLDHSRSSVGRQRHIQARGIGGKKISAGRARREEVSCDCRAARGYLEGGRAVGAPKFLEVRRFSIRIASAGLLTVNG